MIESIFEGQEWGYSRHLLIRPLLVSHGLGQHRWYIGCRYITTSRSDSLKGLHAPSLSDTVVTIRTGPSISSAFRIGSIAMTKDGCD